MNQDKLELLRAFRELDKFSPEAWEERGLGQSDEAVCVLLKTHFDHTADALIAAIEAQVGSEQITRVLESCLSRFDILEYDTEENELICELFIELSTIVEVDFRYQVTAWLYGPHMADILMQEK